MEELQKLVNINESLEMDIAKKQQIIEIQKESIEKLKCDLKQLENMKDQTEKDKNIWVKESDQLKNENLTLRNKLMSLQEDLNRHQLESKSDLKSKDMQISQLSEEINNCKDHMHKAFEICKATHAEEIKEIQSKLDQTEQEKRECLHDLKGTQRDLEKIEKGQVIELKKELIEMNKKMQEIMNESSNRKEKIIKKSCKIVELMDDIREKG